MSADSKDPEAEFADLMKLHQRIVFKVTNTYCRNSHDREDLSQEIFYQLWRAFPRWDRSRKFTTWIYRISLNVAISYIRKGSRKPTAVLDDRLDEAQLHDPSEQGLQEQMREMYALIDKMNQLDRALLMLYLDDHAYSEIAEILGISETNVATKISRLKSRLSKELNPVLDKDTEQ
jgi:RNA polymerase sigma-70 factor (ECF subfamily)